MSSDKKIVKQTEAAARIEKWQQEQLKVVFTNGCFDILHAGHVQYLEQAREAGDRLVIGVNTDASVHRLKGEKRPVCSETDRCRVLAALGSVDAVVMFDEDTPLKLIERLQPDVLVKGADWSVDTIVGADSVLARGGEVKTIKFLEGRSTTGVIERIIEAYCRSGRTEDGGD
ncbi:D-glycero-beta-D-manno-heptose 1-phosphate adenylyltransferase [Prosthecochloris sp. ZM_2]|uniref:D-glycero-beta-D-manno-heptose 1-phosphate adenylyltransferase n=1 Tax=Prosthecochloris sp. ZM_2 TaxID=2045206 RepID=UPI000DF7C2B3|nr:D-glycero-beta-D-manno-heptose 1-phosphate adenylyltransferase [Prosthecochloris sp. ZM_2]RNA64271.1 D-glycero-beta-D-manno-heptose 1-phosphate adenylyltransferase [Prosthecochloris sp. ZM_2]